jgi:hypothetical protein
MRERGRVVSFLVISLPWHYLRPMLLHETASSLLGRDFHTYLFLQRAVS